MPNRSLRNIFAPPSGSFGHEVFQVSLFILRGCALLASILDLVKDLEHKFRYYTSQRLRQLNEFQEHLSS